MTGDIDIDECCENLMYFVFFLMIRRPPRSTLFPYRRSSDLWTNAFQEQLQEVNDRLIWVVREVRDRSENILVKCGVLVEKVVQVNLAKRSQGKATPNEFEPESNEGQGEPDGEVELAGSVIKLDT